MFSMWKLNHVPKSFWRLTVILRLVPSLSWRHCYLSLSLDVMPLQTCRDSNDATYYCWLTRNLLTLPLNPCWCPCFPEPVFFSDISLPFPMLKLCCFLLVKISLVPLVLLLSLAVPATSLHARGSVWFACSAGIPAGGLRSCPSYSGCLS